MASYAGDKNYNAGSLVEKIQAEALVKYSIAGVTRKLVTVAAEAPGAQTITFTKINMGANTLTSEDISSRTDSTTDISATVINTDKATVTPAMYPVRIDQFDTVKMSSQNDPAGYWGGLIANALSAKVDNLLNALFDGFSTSVGTSSVGVTIDNILSALKTLRSNKGQGTPNWVAPSGHIWGAYGIISEILGTSAVAGISAQDEALKNAFIQKVGGVNLYHSEEFTETSNATKSGIFVPQALGYGFVRWPDGSEIRVEYDRTPKQLLDSWIGTFCGGVIEIYDGYGVEVHTKSS